GDNCVYVEGGHDGYQRLSDPVTHRRALLLAKANPEQGLPAHLVIRDLFVARDYHRYTFYYHFCATCRATVGAGQILAIEPRGGELTLAMFGTAGVSAQVTQEWVSHCYGQRARSEVGVFEAQGAGPQEFVTVVIPGAPEHIASLQQRLVDGWPESLRRICSAPGEIAVELPKL